MYRRVIKILLISVFFLLIPEITQAGFLDDIACIPTGNCNLEDIAAGFNSLIRLLLGGMGAAALIFFVWGGIQWLISGGNAERVRSGKTIMVNTVFALILAFGSYIIVSFFINDVLNVKTKYEIIKGPFVTCDDAPRGAVCGENKQCSGEILESSAHFHLRRKCLDICQVKTLIKTHVAECKTLYTLPWKKIEGSEKWCDKGETCVWNSDNL